MLSIMHSTGTLLEVKYVVSKKIKFSKWVGGL